MKINDKLYCYNDEYTYNIDLTINNIYTIKNVDRYGHEINIINDIGENYYFNTDKEYVTYYGKWFHTEQDLRKLKLKKLNESGR